MFLLDSAERRFPPCKGARLYAVKCSVTHYTLLRKVVRPCREGTDARRCPEETFIPCGGKCPFGPQLIRCVHCPWDAGEHILDPADLRYPSGTRTTHQLPKTKQK